MLKNHQTLIREKERKELKKYLKKSQLEELIGSYKRREFDRRDCSFKQNLNKWLNLPWSESDIVDIKKRNTSQLKKQKDHTKWTPV